METDETTKAEAATVDLDSSPFEAQAIAAMPFEKDSVEARAIRRVIEEADRRRAAADQEA